MTPLTGKFYLVVSDHYKRELGRPRRYLGFEAVLNERCLSRDDVIEDLADGQYDAGEIRQIIEVDLGAGTSRDVSREIGQAVDTRLRRKAERDGLSYDYRTPDWITQFRFRGPRRVA